MPPKDTLVITSVPVGRKRLSLPDIDRDPRKQKIRIRSFADGVQGSGAMAHRSKRHGSEMIALCQSELSRNNFPVWGEACAKKLMKLVSAESKVVHEHRADVLPCLRFLSPRKGEVTCLSLLAELDKVYVPCIEALEEKSIMDADRRQMMGMLDRLTDVSQKNRDMHQFASGIDLYAKAHTASSDPDLRKISVLMGFVASAIRCLTPVQMKAPINACVLCHRHDLHRIVCPHHLHEGRYSSSAAQRNRHRAALLAVNARMSESILGHEQELQDLANEESVGELSLQHAQQAFALLFKNSPQLNRLQAIWERSWASGAPIKNMAQSWYGLDEVCDPMGPKRLEQPCSSVLFKWMTDIARFEASVG